MAGQAPLVVADGHRAAAHEHVIEALEVARAAGWAIVRGWGAPLGRERVVCTGWVQTLDDARRALLAAVSGAGLVVGCSIDRDTVDRFVDDLRRLGPVVHVHAQPAPAAQSLRPIERALLGLLAEGFTIPEAAAELGVTRRTADRRLASAHDRLGVGSNAAAIIEAMARGG